MTMAAPSKDYLPKQKLPPSQQVEEEDIKQGPRHSLEALSTAAAAATAATMGEPAAAQAGATVPSTFLSNGDSSLSSNESSFRKLMMSNDSAASAAFLAKMFNTSDAFKSGDSAAHMANIMKSNDLFNSEIFKSMGSVGMDHLFKSGESLNMFKSSGDSSTANMFKSKDMSSLFRSTSSVASTQPPSATVSGMINTQIPDVFTSRDWAADYKPEHHDVEDVQNVFHSNSDGKDHTDPGTKSTSTAIPSGRTDWRALQEEKLTPALVGVKVVNVQPVRPLRPSSQQRKRKTCDESVDSEEKKPKRRPRPRPKVEPEVKVHVEPTPRDVLLGRGGRTNHHAGNRTYLEAKETIQDRYMHASKNDKTAISQELVDIITARGGRFLKLDDEVQTRDKWYPVSNLVARKKASQTLREVNTPEERASKRSKYHKS
jgi:hypothetical protein